MDQKIKLDIEGLNPNNLPESEVMTIAELDAKSSYYFFLKHVKNTWEPDYDQRYDYLRDLPVNETIVAVLEFGVPTTFSSNNTYARITKLPA